MVRFIINGDPRVLNRPPSCGQARSVAHFTSVQMCGSGVLSSPCSNFEWERLFIDSIYGNRQVPKSKSILSRGCNQSDRLAARPCGPCGRHKNRRRNRSKQPNFSASRCKGALACFFFCAHCVCVQSESMPCVQGVPSVYVMIHPIAVCTRVHVHVCTHVHVRKHIRAPVCAHVCTHDVCAHAYLYTCLYACPHVCLYACSCAYACLYACLFA